MKKSIIIMIYFLLFWIILPLLLVAGANYLDKEMFRDMILPNWCRTVGFIVLIPGFIMMLLSVNQFRYYGKEFPVSSTPPDTIIQKGLFSAWRHPIYLFAVVSFSGLALIMRSCGFLYVVLPVFIFLTSIYIWREEKLLVKRFGIAYEQYKTRTNLVIPKLHKWLKVLAFPVFKIGFNLKISNKENIPPSPPFFTVASHRNYLDPFIISYSLPWIVRHISTYEMFRTSLKKKIFTLLGAIPKKRYTSDPRSIIIMKHALEQGYPVGVFPSGERSWTGITQSFKQGSVQMFRKFNHVPILPIRIEGNYYLWPRWSPRMLRSQVKISFGQVINTDIEPDDEKLEKLITDGITPQTDADKSLYCRSKKITGNLSCLLYRCPACFGSESLKEIPPRTFKCKKCNTSMEIDPWFKLKYNLNGKILCQTIDALYNIIKLKPVDLAKAKVTDLLTDEQSMLAVRNIFFRAGCTLWLEENDSFVSIGKGMAYLTEKAVSIVIGSSVINIPFVKLGAVTIESYYRLQLYLPSEKLLYQVTFDQESIIKWQDAILLLMERSGLKTPFTR